jgi:hypothetical protein
MRDFDAALTGLGRVSRGSPVHTALRNCTRDEGRSFEVGNQVLISSHRKLLSSKAMVVSVAEKSEQDSGSFHSLRVGNAGGRLVRNVRNLDGDAKGKDTSGSDREAESTDAPEGAALLRRRLRERAMMMSPRAGHHTRCPLAAARKVCSPEGPDRDT